LEKQFEEHLLNKEELQGQELLNSANCPNVLTYFQQQQQLRTRASPLCVFSSTAGGLLLLPPAAAAATV
jgi:hypothetical protein